MILDKDSKLRLRFKMTSSATLPVTGSWLSLRANAQDEVLRTKKKRLVSINIVVVHECDTYLFVQVVSLR
jgi:hypothetical protein